MTKDIKYYLSLNYKITLEKISEDDGGGYSASIPNLGKYAFHGEGETVEDALNNLEEVKEFLFASYLENGTNIPEPATEEDQAYSGKFLMRVPKQLHRILAVSAKKEGLSLNQYVQFLLSSAAVAHSFDNIIDNYSSKFDKMLKEFSNAHHHYEFEQGFEQKKKVKATGNVFYIDNKYAEAS